MKRKVTERRKVARPDPRPLTPIPRGCRPSPFPSPHHRVLDIGSATRPCASAITCFRSIPGGSSFVLKTPNRTQLSPVSCDLWRQNSKDLLLGGYKGHFLRSCPRLGPVRASLPKGRPDLPCLPCPTGLAVCTLRTLAVSSPSLQCHRVSGSDSSWRIPSTLCVFSEPLLDESKKHWGLGEEPSLMQGGQGGAGRPSGSALWLSRPVTGRPCRTL